MTRHSLCIGIATIVLAAGATVAGQTPVKLRSISPYKVGQLVNESKREWDKNHVSLEIDLSAVWERLKVVPGEFETCSGDCEARIFRHELDGQPGKEVLLKLTRSFDFCRYLVFKRTRASASGWKLLGFIDHDFNRYQMARHRVVNAYGKNWLVIRGQEGSGSGFQLYGETWYEVSGKGARPVLSYPSQGNTLPCIGLDREFKTEVVTPKHSAKRTIVVRYSVSYGIANCSTNPANKDNKLFSNRHRAYYIWDGRAHGFVFSRSQSDITEREIEAIANIRSEDAEDDGGTTIGDSKFYSEVKGFVGGGYEVFLKYNLGRLLRVAEGKDARRREWLQQFLNDCHDTPEKKALLRALRKESGR